MQQFHCHSQILVISHSHSQPCCSSAARRQQGVALSHPRMLSVHATEEFLLDLGSNRSRQQVAAASVREQKLIQEEQMAFSHDNTSLAECQALHSDELAAADCRQVAGQH